MHAYEDLSSKARCWYIKSTCSISDGFIFAGRRFLLTITFVFLNESPFKLIQKTMDRVPRRYIILTKQTLLYTVVCCVGRVEIQIDYFIFHISYYTFRLLYTYRYSCPILSIVKLALNFCFDATPTSCLEVFRIIYNEGASDQDDTKEHDARAKQHQQKQGWFRFSILWRFPFILVRIHSEMFLRGKTLCLCPSQTATPKFIWCTRDPPR